MTTSDLKVIAELTVDLTRLRQNECKHLCIENVGPEIFHALICAWYNAQPVLSIDPYIQRAGIDLGSVQSDETATHSHTYDLSICGRHLECRCGSVRPASGDSK